MRWQDSRSSPQSMRVWLGLRLMGAGGKIPKTVFVAVAEVEPDGVRLDNGMRLKNQELRATRPSHAVTYASCQGLTLHNRVLGRSLATPILGLTPKSMWMTCVSNWSSFEASGARARFAAALTAMRLLWLMTSVVSGHPGLEG